MKPRNFETFSMWIHIWSLVSMCSTQVETKHITSFSVRIQYIIVQGMCRRACSTLVDEYWLSSITDRIVLMFIPMIDICGWPPFSCSGASFMFFENAEYHLCIINSSIHSDSVCLYQQLNHFHRRFAKMSTEFDINTSDGRRINTYRYLSILESIDEYRYYFLVSISSYRYLGFSVYLKSREFSCKKRKIFL